MIYRRVRIKDWTIRFLFSFGQDDRAFVVGSLLWAEAPTSIISQVTKNLKADRLNEGFCYSEPSLRRTVLGIGAASSGPEVMNTIVHEIFHICQHISEEDGIDPYGEKIAYLAGDISREVSDIVCELSCPHCGGK